MTEKINKVTYGIEQGHIHKLGEGGLPGPGIPLKGLVSFTPSADGSQNIFYADNIAYHVMNSNNGYTADITTANIPDEMLAWMLGWEQTADGRLVELADGQAEPFAFSFQVQGDQRDRRMLFYNCVASRPAKENTTNTDSTQIVPDILSVKITPISVGGRKLVKDTIELSDTNKEVYDAWFTAPTFPTFAGE